MPTQDPLEGLTWTEIIGGAAILGAIVAFVAVFLIAAALR